MRVHIVEHMDLLGGGYVYEWMRKTNHRFTLTRIHKGESLPDPDRFDFLVLLGGVMSVYDEATYPWLKTEKKWLRGVIESGKRVLGICFGAQLIASAMGAEVRKHTYSEAGWWPVSFHPHADRHPFLKNVPVPDVFFQFHGDTFDLSPESSLLAGSAACSRQMFAVNDRVLGMQFHPEFTPASIHFIAKHLTSSLRKGPFIQPGPDMLAALHHCRASRKFLFSMLSNVEAEVEAGTLSVSS